MRSAKGRKLSSTIWLKRQLNDPYVAEANRKGYRSRAAFKLSEIDDRFNFLQPGKKVVDLGAAPGGWSQVAAERVNALGELKSPKGSVVSVDIQEFANVPGTTSLQLDITDSDSSKRIRSILNGPCDIVLSDMATSATGHILTDHIRIMGLLEIAFEFAFNNLSPGGVFLGKVLRGGTEETLLKKMKICFGVTKHVKPKSSRTKSRETFVIATEFKRSVLE